MSHLRLTVVVDFWSFLTYILLGSAISINISQFKSFKRLYLDTSQTFDKKALSPGPHLHDFVCKPLFWILVCVYSPLSLFLHFGFHFLFFSTSSFLWFVFFSKVTIHKVAKYFSNGDTITVIMMTITVIININLIIMGTAIIILILITSPCIRCPVMFHVVIPLPSLLPSPCWLTYHTAAWKWTPLNKRTINMNYHY